MREHRKMHARFEIKLESIELDLVGWLKSLLPQNRGNPLGNFGARRHSLSAKRDLLARHNPLLDKHGY